MYYYPTPMRTTPTATFTQVDIDGGGTASTTALSGSQHFVVNGSGTGRRLTFHCKCEAELWL